MLVTLHVVAKYYNHIHVHFLTSYMNENENCDQTLESAQYRLEINRNWSDFFGMVQKPRKGSFRFRELKIQYISRISNGQPPSEAHVGGKILSPSS